MCICALASPYDLATSHHHSAAHSAGGDLFQADSVNSLLAEAASLEKSWTIAPTAAVPTPVPSMAPTFPTQTPTKPFNPASPPTWAPTVAHKSHNMRANGGSIAQQARIAKLEAEEKALEQQTGEQSGGRARAKQFNKKELLSLEKEIHDVEYGVRWG